MPLTPLDRIQQRRHKRRNRVQTALLIAGSVALLGLCAWMLWGWTGLVAAALSGAIGLFIAYRASPKMVLRLYKARRVDERAMPQVHRILGLLSQRAGLPRMPELYYVPSRMMNAFAVGRPGDSATAITDGLIRGLTLRELAGVLAHEVSHVRNEDIRVMALADVVSRMTSTLSTIGLFAAAFRLTGIVGHETLPWPAILVLLVAPTIGGFLQLALSRAREYDADLDAAGLTGDPEGLASALVRLEKTQGRLWEGLSLPGSRLPDPSLLRTHPRTEDRVARLLSLRDEASPQIEIPAAAQSVPASFPTIHRRPRLRVSGLWY